MQVMPDESQAPASLAEIQQIMSAGVNPYNLTGWSREQKLAWIAAVLQQCQYDLLPRAGKGLVKAYLQEATTYSRAQVTRFIAENRRGSVALPTQQAATIEALANVMAAQATLEEEVMEDFAESAVDMYAEPAVEVEPIISIEQEPKRSLKWEQLEWLASSALAVTAVWALISLGAVDYALRGLGLQQLMTTSVSNNLPPQIVVTGSDSTDAAAALMRTCLQEDSLGCSALSGLDIPISDRTSEADLKQALKQVLVVDASQDSLLASPTSTDQLYPLTKQQLAAQAKMPAGEVVLPVWFERVFLSKPVVNASPSKPLPYAVSNVTERGFLITLAEPSEQDIYFSWLALAN